jgi:lipoprotein-anchoring transpeptidase ErfK/SrfK
MSNNKNSSNKKKPSNRKNLSRCVGIAVLLAGTALWTNPAQSQVFAMVATDRVGPPVFHDGTAGAAANAPSYAPAANEQTDDADVPARLHRQVVDYPTAEAPGTVIVDTPNTYLYFVLGGGKAMRYGIGVGREGFTWSGVKTIERKTEWPDWFPPAEMLARQPYLPRFMAGGPGNPLGARAMYLGGTVYRIHGTNAPDTIGTQVSSGCIRMVNDDVIDLFGRTRVGTKVIVMPMRRHDVVGMR